MRRSLLAAVAAVTVLATTPLCAVWGSRGDRLLTESQRAHRHRCLSLAGGRPALTALPQRHPQLVATEVHFSDSDVLAECDVETRPEGQRIPDSDTSATLPPGSDPEPQRETLTNTFGLDSPQGSQIEVGRLRPEQATCELLSFTALQRGQLFGVRAWRQPRRSARSAPASLSPGLTISDSRISAATRA